MWPVEHVQMVLIVSDKITALHPFSSTFLVFHFNKRHRLLLVFCKSPDRFLPPIWLGTKTLHPSAAASAPSVTFYHPL